MPPFPRTVNLIYLIFLAGWFWSLAVTIPPLRKFTSGSGRILPGLKTICRIVLLFVFATRPNTINAVSDLFVSGPGFRSQLAKRERIIRSALAREERDIVLPRITDGPRSLFFNDITFDPRHWKNRAFASYYNLSTVTGAEPELLRWENRDRILRRLAAGSVPNLLEDPGFEAGGESWSVRKNWLVNDIVYSGATAVRLKAENFSGKNFWFLRQGPLILESGRDYFFGAFVRTENLDSPVTITIKELDAGKSPSSYSTRAIGGDNDWTPLIGVYRARSPAGVKTTRVEFRAARILHFREGTAWVDNAFLVPTADFPID